MFRRFPVLLIVFAITTFLASCKTAEDFYGSGPITMTPKIKKFVDRYTKEGQSNVVAVRTDGKRAHAAWCGALACSGGGEEFLALDGCESKGGKCWIYAMNGYVVWKGPVTVAGQGGETMAATQLSSPDSNPQSNVARLKRDRACPKCNLKGVRLLATDLQGANLQKANLKGAHFDYANLQGADLRNANLIGARLYNTNLQDSNLKGADLQNAMIIGANLKGADLSNANLRGARLDYADLRGANFTGTNLREVNLSFAKIDSDVFAMAKKAGAFGLR